MAGRLLQPDAPPILPSGNSKTACLILSCGDEPVRLPIHFNYSKNDHRMYSSVSNSPFHYHLPGLVTEFIAETEIPADD